MTAKKTKKPAEYEPDLSNPDEAFYEGYCLARQQIADATAQWAASWGVVRSMEATTVARVLSELAASIRYGVSPECPGKTPVKAPPAKRKKAVRK
jgi:hypothetical protein